MSNKIELRKDLLLGFVFSVVFYMTTLGYAAEMTSPRTTTARHGGILRIGEQVEAEQIGDPVGPSYTSTCFKRAVPVIETLLRYDKTGVVVPWLATAWKVSKDLDSITLTLRKGVKFHDGTDFNAQTCKWNLERYRTSNNPELKVVKSIDIIDDFTIRLNISKWDSTLLDTLAYTPGMMISPTAYQKAGSTDKERSDWARINPVGTGPFKFVSWNREVKIKYEKFSDYWQKGKPYLEGIEIVVIPNPVTRLLSFRKGEVDIITTVDPRDVKELEREGNYIVTMSNLSSLASCVAGDSAHRNSHFSDIRVRRAVEYAVDKKALVDALTQGYGNVCNQYAPMGSWGLNPDVKGYPYDPSKAKQLLAEAGYSKGFKTKLISPNFGLYVPIPPAIQEYLRKVGIDAEIEMLSSAAYQSVLRAGWQDSLLFLEGSQNFPDVARVIVDKISARMFMKGTMLFPDDYTAALTNAVNATDFATKQKWTWEVQRLLIDKYALVQFFFMQPRTNVINKKFQDTGFGVTIDAQWTPEDARMK
jgi:peptide/nickel transport system substrate-binding protein